MLFYCEFYVFLNYVLLVVCRKCNDQKKNSLHMRIMTVVSQKDCKYMSSNVWGNKTNQGRKSVQHWTQYYNNTMTIMAKSIQLSFCPCCTTVKDLTKATKSIPCNCNHGKYSSLSTSVNLDSLTHLVGFYPTIPVDCRHFPALSGRIPGFLSKHGCLEQIGQSAMVVFQLSLHSSCASFLMNGTCSSSGDYSWSNE